MKPVKEILMYGHGGSANRGCEAIVRSTAELAREELGLAVQFRLSSRAPQEDRDAGLGAVAAIMDSGAHWRKGSPGHVIRAALWHACRDRRVRHVLDNVRTLRRAGRADLGLSVGGDNYCYDPVDIYYALNRWLSRRCRRLVMWGCSIEPARMDTAMLADLRRFDLITARETITCSALRDRGIDRVRLYPDPAFALEPEELPLPREWADGQMVGVNISPLISRYEAAPGAALAACAALIRHILDRTELGVVLIPHVMGPGSDDRLPLGDLYHAFPRTERIVMAPGGMNAPQTKGLIARCRFMVCARTHASIAAYSTTVPTLVLGYSVKARGIARDLFGEEKDLVLPVQELDDSRQLVRLFDGLLEREQELRRQLRERIPHLVEQNRAAIREIGALLHS